MKRLNVVVAILLVCLLAAVGTSLARQSQDSAKAEQPADAPIPADAVAKKNPVKPTAEGLASARKLYGYHCAMCHGKDGDGKGDLATDMKLDLRDWRDAGSISKYTDGELFYIVTNGRGKMLGGEGDRTTDTVRWNLVNLVRSFGQKGAASNKS
jgi:mono/diheme cytochrome c family protein